MSRTPELSIPSHAEQVTGVIEKGCEFEGKLSFLGTVRLGGIFKGEVYTPDTLIVGEGARVEGTIDAGVVIISGEVRGTVKARDRVELHRPAVFRGDIVTPSLSLDEGVIFEGSNKMSRAVQSDPPASLLVEDSSAAE